LAVSSKISRGSRSSTKEISISITGDREGVINMFVVHLPLTITVT
jgi:hypothetical protein